MCLPGVGCSEAIMGSLEQRPWVPLNANKMGPGDSCSAKGSSEGHEILKGSGQEGKLERPSHGAKANQ